MCTVWLWRLRKGRYDEKKSTHRGQREKGRVERRRFLWRFVDYAARVLVCTLYSSVYTVWKSRPLRQRRAYVVAKWCPATQIKIVEVGPRVLFVFMHVNTSRSRKKGTTASTQRELR